jgi:hypothetical protein
MMQVPAGQATGTPRRPFTATLHHDQVTNLAADKEG